jgi:hypothetical protein
MPSTCRWCSLSVSISPQCLPSGSSPSTFLQQHSVLHQLTTPHPVNMRTFWGLPRAVREKIYRLHLVADEQPVDFEAYKKSCGYTETCEDEVIHGHISRYSHPRPAKLKMPELLQVSRRVEREASPIYFGENTFGLSSPESLYVWKRYTWRRHINQIRKVVLLYWTRFKVGAADEAFKEFGKLPKLESLTFIINETNKAESMLHSSRYPDDCKSVHRAIRWDESLGFGPQINLLILRLNGMAGLRSLRGLRDVKFLDRHSGDVGSVPGGFLENTIKKEIMQPQRSKIAT